MIWGRANLKKNVWHSSKQALRMDLRRICSLAFMPVNRVEEVFDYLWQTACPELDFLFFHLEKNYVKGELLEDGTRGKVRYPPHVSLIDICLAMLKDLN